MGWATRHIEKLSNGEEVSFRPRGHSMSGIIDDGQLVTIKPIIGDTEVGDVVLCKVNGNEYLHIVKAKNGDRFLIGNNRGGINGWTSRASIYGKYFS